MTAKEYLQGKYEWHKKHWNEHEHVDDEFTASEMEAYHQAKLKLLDIPIVSVSESDIDAMFPFEDVETARPTRPEKRILAYNNRQADRREGAKRLLSKLHSR